MKYRHKKQGFIVDVAKSQTSEAGKIAAKNEATMIADYGLLTDNYVIARDGKWTITSKTALDNNFEPVE
jgi:hypothetical protein